MEKYFNKILDHIFLEGNSKIWIFILLEIFFALFTAFSIEKLKKIVSPIYQRLRERSLKRDLEIHKGRDTAIDITRGIFIISMLIGHFKINNMLRCIIYSCHMVGFVFFSGYFYRESNSIWKTIRHIIHTFLMPYIIFVVGMIMINVPNMSISYIKELFIKYIGGFSFSKKIFSENLSVGPVYFILVLFAVRFIYLFVSHFIQNELVKSAVIISISIGGMLLGREGFWLPWSIDLACYVLIFYHIGIYSRKYNLLSKVKSNHIFYFLLTPVWAYMIYAGSMEIAVRNYGQYGLVILGSLAGVLTIYKLAVYISETLPVTRKLLQLTGERSVIVIIVHTLFGGRIHALVSCRFDSKYLPYLITVVFLQIILSWMIKKGIDLLRRWTQITVSFQKIHTR